MKRFIVAVVSLCLFTNITSAQEESGGELTVDMIMEGDQFVGSLPSFSHWSANSREFYFYWNRDNVGQDSLYSYSVKGGNISMVEKSVPSNFIYSSDRELYLFEDRGDIFISSVKRETTQQITNTVDKEYNPSFSEDNSRVYYREGNNIYSWDIEQGTTEQITNFISGEKSGEKSGTSQDEWLKQDQLSMMEVLSRRVDDKAERKEAANADKKCTPKAIYIGKSSLSDVSVSSNGEIVLYSLYKRGNGKRTDVPNYVTESSYTENISARNNVGADYGSSELFIYSVDRDTIIEVSFQNLEGIFDKPAYFEEYPELKDREEKEREISIYNISWSTDREKVALILRANDNKDIWIASVNLTDGELIQLDRQHDDAWVSGPGVGRVLGWLHDNETIYFQSERSGYSHLYTLNVESRDIREITSGNFEVYDPKLSNSGDKFFFSSNEGNSGVRNLYEVGIKGDNKIALTTKQGRVDVKLSPDEKQVAALCSNSNIPTELFMGELNSKGVNLNQITNSTTNQFNSYSWAKPEIVDIPTADGVKAKARLYKPSAEKSNGKAVIFVHGAGYLQNAHQWWSSYFREYMFHNLLKAKGYTVLDIDYRGSAGYGREWRTGIYRHMGGKDLSDNIDGANYLVKEHNVDSDKIGIYGGSYGGFITLMALFNSDTFAAGAALRSVTDWAHYNHGYTANILNTPVLDPKSYKRSSPIYYAEGLNEPLLICHGMVDDNVHFQDVVRLSQRLIELRKENWEMAIYPMERHGFVEPSSWADEYRRILKLFQENL